MSVSFQIRDLTCLVDHQIAGMSALYRVVNGTEEDIKMDSFVVDKKYDGVPPAPRPPKAVPILGINDGWRVIPSLIMTGFGVLVSVF